jgi:hypothetical protein
MNLIKHVNYFDPMNIEEEIHIIGCGAIGSTLAEMLTRMGVGHINLYDFDFVNPHNIANQMFNESHINMNKEEALCQILHQINPQQLKTIHGEYTEQRLSGYVFLCVDNIDLRRKIIDDNKYNQTIKAVFDFRMRLTDAQHYAADWKNYKQIEELLKTMQFTHEEAKTATPTNACGTTMNIITTVRLICALGLGNFINFVRTDSLKKMILADTSTFIVDAF